MSFDRNFVFQMVYGKRGITGLGDSLSLTATFCQLLTGEVRQFLGRPSLGRPSLVLRPSEGGLQHDR